MLSAKKYGGRHIWRQLTAALLLAVCYVLSTDAVLAEGARQPAIVAICANCHGSDGTTGTVVTPNLAGQKSIYLRQQLLAFRSGARKHPDMKVISRDLTDREIDQVVVYYSTLQP
jgi:cytochrome c553